MIEEQPAADSGELIVECPTCGIDALARLDEGPVANGESDGPDAAGRSDSPRARSRRATRFDIGDTAPVFGVCIECGFGLIVNPPLYSDLTRRAA